jgi:hypothetical protein
VNM